MGLTGFGCLFTVLGIFFLFDRGLLAMGNVRLAPASLGRLCEDLGILPTRARCCAAAVPRRRGDNHRPGRHCALLHAAEEPQGAQPSASATSAGCMSCSPQKLVQGSGFYLAGVLLVLWGWSVVGILLESYGFFVLFSGFFPTVLGFLRRLPGFGPVLDLPIFKVVSSWS